MYTKDDTAEHVMVWRFWIATPKAPGQRISGLQIILEISKNQLLAAAILCEIGHLVKFVCKFCLVLCSLIFADGELKHLSIHQFYTLS